VFVLSGDGQIEVIPVADAENGKGISTLLGRDPAVRRWGDGMFGGGGQFNSRAFGAWLIEDARKCGPVDPSGLDLRGQGVWPSPDGDGAVANVGDALILSDGRAVSLRHFDREKGPRAPIFIGFPPIPRPAPEPCTAGAVSGFARLLASLWNFEQRHAGHIVTSFAALSMLGGAAHFRPILMVTGARGSGKSTLAETLATLIGPMAGGGVINGFSEAGLRQLRNNTAMALILDEVEAADGQSKDGQTRTLGLLRRMTTDDGGRVVRGSAGHDAMPFRVIGTPMVAGINPPRQDAATASRTIHLSIAGQSDRDPGVAIRHIERLESQAWELQPSLWTQMLRESPRWPETFNVMKVAARGMGADARRADAAAALAAAGDMATHKGAPKDWTERVKRARAMMAVIIGTPDQGRDDGDDADDCALHLTASFVATSPSLAPRAVSDLIWDAFADPNGGGPRRALGLYGMALTKDRGHLLVADRHPQLDRLFAGTRWAEGGWRTALLGLAGAEKDLRRIGGKVARCVAVPLASIWSPDDRQDDETVTGGQV
jgi:energy-coupling factor transporter ATP-binding protein EcfA2